MVEAQDNFKSNDHKLDEHQILEFRVNPLQEEAARDLSSGPRIVSGRIQSRGRDAGDGIFTVDSGVTQAQLKHAEAIVNALPDPIQQALRDGNVKVELTAGWHQGLPQGENDSTQGQVYTDSGMTDQALVHELYEMVGQISPSTIAGSWNDAKAVKIADKDTARILNGNGEDPGDLNDTLSEVQFANGFQDPNNVHGDGDLMSNAFVADFYATNQSLYQDKIGGSTLLTTIQNAPDLVSYIAKAQGLTDAAHSSDLPFQNNVAVG